MTNEAGLEFEKRQEEDRIEKIAVNEISDAIRAWRRREERDNGFSKNHLKDAQETLHKIEKILERIGR